MGVDVFDGGERCGEERTGGSVGGSLGVASCFRLYWYIL